MFTFHPSSRIKRCRSWWSELYGSGGIMQPRVSEAGVTVYEVRSVTREVNDLIATTSDLGEANRIYNDAHDYWYANCR